VFAENFEGSGGVWPKDDRDNFAYGITDGRFRILVKSGFVDVWTVREREFTDVRLEVDLSRGSGPEDGYAGLVCRFQDNGNYYAMVVDGQRGYRIFKKMGGVSEDLGQPGESSGILTGDSSNRLRVDCVEDTITFFINGERFLEIRDESFSAGRVGLIGGTKETPGLELFFDDFLIANP
jgi:hypothetical protein